MYDEVAYWNQRVYPTDPSMSTETTMRHIEYIKTHVNGVKDVLDFGPGIGRTLRAYVGIETVTAYDISIRYWGDLITEAQRLGLSVGIDFNGKIGELPYVDKQFDIAVASEVLLHQRPEHLFLVMSELARVAKKIVVISWQQGGIPFEDFRETKSMNHCFHYDYLKICKENGWEVSDVEYVNRQIYFTYRGE